jgi:uncharacterized protein (TIGR03067 family)
LFEGFAMRRWIAAALPVLLVGCLGPRPASPTTGGVPGATRPATPAADIDRIQGEWEVIGLVADGAPGRSPGGRFLFREDNLTAERVTGMRYRLDPAAQPARIDVFTDDGQTPLFRGVYAFRGETLLLCQAIVSEPRPDGFESRKGDNRLFYTLRRPSK